MAAIDATEMARLTDPTESSPVPLAEVVHEFPTYGDAAKDACKFVNPAPKEHDLRFYISRLGPAKGKKVGLGIQGTSSILDLVRLDNDDSGKGIHFNARKKAGDNQDKLAAVIKPTIAMDKKKRQDLYNGFVNDLQDIAAPVTLWNAWLSGRQPKNVALADLESEEGAGATAGEDKKQDANVG